MHLPPESIVRLGLIQTACSPDPAANVDKTLAAAGRAAEQGAQIICTQELFRSQYFCQAEDHQYFSLAEPIPGPTTRAFQAFAQDRQAVDLSLPCSKNGRRAFTTTPPLSSTRMARCWAPTARCISRMTRCITKSSILHPATWAFAASPLGLDASACWCAGTNGSRRPRDLLR